MEKNLKRGDLFSPQLTSEVFSLVKGNSSLIRLADKTAVPFNGKDVFTFTFENEVDIVAEGGAKSHGGVGYKAVTMTPIKVEYGARITDEFLYASEDGKIELLKDFKDGFAKKLARAIDIMAIHGINPRTKQDASTINANNVFTKAVTNEVTHTKGQSFADVEKAIGLLGDEDVSGLLSSPAFSRDLATVKENNVSVFPELAWGGKPTTLNGLDYEVNSTVSVKEGVQAIIGDFRNCFKWGMAKDIIFTTIEYGDPDNTNRDLAGHNEVYLRAEAYIGWGIINPEAFAVIKDGVGA